ncbi:UDP-N-acetylglucosamine transferase subunit Alg13p [[Candida] jaroonii]|uniref:UDP-N-acetylglucosamine transferase subunit Alg13p n=1 Tax=[Candida] jaroonii TaxID=467808 RepID=A0ACA9Y864_9ASCO|nr:UDP-N-acetylglucosamine transferase subunit Alg13p [[Candida] jaroonii]
MKLLITTGATVTFKKLISFTITEFIQPCIDLGFDEVYIQYGNEIDNGQHLSKEFINQCLEGVINYQLTSLEGEFLLERGGKSIKLIFFPFSNNLSKYIQASDIIISHGGTGTIIDILKYSKPLLVVYNEELMGNHQKEIAEEFTNLNYCINVSSENLDEEQITSKVKKLITNEVKLSEYESNSGKVIQGIIYHEINRVKS